MSVGPVIRLVFHVADEQRQRQVIIAGDGSMIGGTNVSELGVTVKGDAQTRYVEVCPESAVQIEEITAEMNLALGDADAIYLNGFNSWTDSIERPVYDRMWGLTRISKRTVDRYVLDASGDYRFTTEDARPGHMHGFSYGYLRQGDQVLLFGSLDETNGYTLIREDADAGRLTFVKEPPLGVMAAGQRRTILSLALVGGTLDEAVDRWVELAGLSALPAEPLVGYTSWYRHYGNIDAWKLQADLASAAEILAQEDLDGLTPAFQIDDGYAKVGDWLEYDRARFPEGLASIACAAAEKGLLPGLWLAPFICEKDSRVFLEHRDWLLRDESGQAVTTGDQWSGGFALDVCHPEVRAYIAKVLRTVTQDWGFGLLKLDFLYGACMVPHQGLNRAELMHDAISLLRESVAPGTRLLLCGVPLASAFGQCEYCRIGPDVGLDWDDKPHMRILHRERVSTKWSLANARGRAHLDKKVFRCDPDVYFLRTDGVSLTAQQRAYMLDTDSSCGGVLFTSDDMGAWTPEQHAAFRETLARYKAYNGV